MILTAGDRAALERTLSSIQSRLGGCAYLLGQPDYGHAMLTRRKHETVERANLLKAEVVALKRVLGLEPSDLDLTPVMYRPDAERHGWEECSHEQA